MQNICDRIIIGELEQLRSDDELDFTFDGSFVPLKNDEGGFDFLNVDLGAKNYFNRFVGTLEDPLKKHEYFELDYNGHAEFWPCGIWIMSAYKFDDGMVLAVCHREIVHKTDPHFPLTYYTGLAVSHDGGKKWKYIGDVVANQSNYQGDFHANMGGCPLLVRDGYIYFYFNDFDEKRVRRVTAARMSIEEAKTALHEEKLPPVFKYSGNGVWDTDPWNGTGAEIMKHESYRIDAHSKGVYSSALGKYLVTMQTGGVGKLLMFASDDCEHFDDGIVIDSNDEKLMQPYSFFVSCDGNCSDDMNTIGGDFYIYFPRKGTGETKGYDYDEFYRRKITIK